MWKNRLLRFSKWFFGILLGLVILISVILYSFKDEICDAVVAELNTYLTTEIEVSSIDLTFWSSFPNLSVDFNHLFIKDTYEGATNLDTLMYSDRVRLKFNPFDVWRENYTVKAVEISPGTLQLKVNEKGENNYDIVKQRDEAEGGEVDLNLESITAENFRVSYANKATDQVYRTKLSDMELSGALSSSVFTTVARSNLTILEARSGNVPLLYNQAARLNIAVNVNQESNTVEIPLSTIFISELPFTFKGDIDSSGYNFNVQGQNIGIADAANRFSVQQSEDIKKFEGSGSLLFNLDVNGENEATSPAKIRCQFGIKKGYLKDPTTGLSLRSLSLDGEYSNVEGKEKEFLHLKDMSFSTKGGPFKGNLKITKFETPRFQGNANGSLDLSILHSLFHVPSIDQLDGTVDIHSDFLVTSIHNGDETVDYNIEKCEGDVALKKVNIQLVDDQRRFQNINGLVYLRNNEAGVKDISLRLGKSDFAANGVFRNIFQYFKREGNLVADVAIKSKTISISDLGSTSKAEKIEGPREYVLPNDIEGSLALDVERMDYADHLFKYLQGTMSIKDRVIRFPQISVQSGGADIRGSITIEERQPEYFYLTSQLVSKNVQFKPLFREWNDFNQDVIRSSNIEGIVQANVTFEAPFDLRTGIKSNGIRATIGLQIDDGRLKDVSTFRTITESLRTSSSAKTIIGKKNIDSFEKKLKDLRFNRLTNTLVIQNGILTIPNMSISSSALDIEVAGQHTFDNIIDYRFGFRLRDIKEEKTSEFGEIVDDGSGMRVYVRMYGPMSDPTIEWDKEASKANREAYREEEKATMRSMFKSEFGLFKNDTTVQEYIPQKRIRERIEIDYNPTDSIDELFDEKKPSPFQERRKKFEEKLKNMGEPVKEEESEIIFD